MIDFDRSRIMALDIPGKDVSSALSEKIRQQVKLLANFCPVSVRFWKNLE